MSNGKPIFNTIHTKYPKNIVMLEFIQTLRFYFLLSLNACVVSKLCMKVFGKTVHKNTPSSQKTITLYLLKNMSVHLGFKQIILEQSITPVRDQFQVSC